MIKTENNDEMNFESHRVNAHINADPKLLTKGKFN